MFTEQISLTSTLRGKRTICQSPQKPCPSHKLTSILTNYSLLLFIPLSSKHSSPNITAQCFFPVFVCLFILKDMPYISSSPYGPPFIALTLFPSAIYLLKKWVIALVSSYSFPAPALKSATCLRRLGFFYQRMTFRNKGVGISCVHC